jgi:hypothetical protein
LESGLPLRVQPNPNGMIFVVGFFIHQMHGHEILLDGDAICLNFQQQNSLKNQYLPHISFENCEIKTPLNPTH